MKKVEQKYYWYVYSHKNASGGRTYVTNVTYRHPFTQVHSIVDKDQFGSNVALVNWKEITKEEFDLYRSYNT